MSPKSLTVTPENAGGTLAALLRSALADHSWGQVRRLIETRRATVNGELCLDPARRLKEGDAIELLARPAPKPHEQETIRIRHLDEHLVVVEKPAGDATPVKRSRFGRPLRRGAGRGAPAPAPEGA